MTLRLETVERTIPLHVPFTISRGTQNEARLVHLRISDGVHEGWGEASPAPSVVAGTPEQVAAALRALDPALLDPDDIPGTLARLSGLAPTARAAVDIALHDLAGHASGTPVHEALGLPDGEVHTAATVTVADPADAARQARAWRERFFDVLKLKLADAREGLAVVEAVRAAVPDATLFVDANEAFDLDGALAVVDDLAELGVALVEQPLPRADREGLARLAADAPVPIVLDEAITGADDVAAWADVDGNLGFNVKVQKVGGLAAAVACIEAAREQDRPVLVGCNIESGLGIAAGAALTGVATHADLDGNLFLQRDPFPFPRVGPGRVTTLEGPGLGVHPHPRFASTLDARPSPARPQDQA